MRFSFVQGLQLPPSPGKLYIPEQAGLLDKRHAWRSALTGACAELLGYGGNAAQNALTPCRTHLRPSQHAGAGW